MDRLRSGATVCDLFQEQVQRDPDRTALVDRDREITYGQLSARARDVADELLERGIGSEQIVGICVEPCAEMLVGMLGVLLAGAAYLPIDPETPVQRVRRVVQDANAVAVLTTAGTNLTDVVPDTTPIVYLDNRAIPGVPSPRHGVTNKASADNLAYVIYTSGSTGRPKGVEIEHRSLLALIDIASAEFGFGPADVVPLFHAFAFDVSIWEIWTALAYGGRLVIVPAHQKDPTSMVRLLRAHRVTVLNQTPTAFSALLPELARTDLDEMDLRLVIFAGEAVNDEILRRCLSLEGSPTLVNMYGITEVTVHATIQRVSRQLLTSRCPVGKPISHLSVLVVDDDLGIAPAGHPGEIYVGGIQVARGYLGRPALTAERFVPSPFAEGERLYRSGDIGQYLADGSIECLGRIDEQVKIRGYRVEPREVEESLLRDDSVEEALVVARGEADDRRLIAYLVTNGPEPSPTALRSFLGRSLPSYMIPSAFVFLDALPRTSNGKVDRRALPHPMERPQLLTTLVGPSTPNEESLCSIWASVLQIDAVGIDDDFIELGGDSILAARMTSRAREAGFRFSVRDVFRHPTVRELGEALGEATPEHTEDWAEVVGEFSLTAVQQQLVDLGIEQGRPAVQSAVIHFSDPVEIDSLREGLTIVLGHHDILRSCVRVHERGSHAVIPSLLDVDLGEAVGLTEVAASARQSPRHVAANLTSLLDQRRGILVAAAVLRGDRATPDRVVLVIDHLAVDLVSWHVLVDDVIRAYDNVTSGTAPRLPPKSTSFQRWTRDLVDHSESDALLDEIPFWSAVLERAANVHRLSCRDAKPDGLTTPTDEALRSQRITHRLPPDLTTGLLRATAAIGRPNEVVLAALACSYVRSSGGDRAWIDIESHGRDGMPHAVDLSRTVGCFTAVFPAVIGAPADGKLVEFVRTVSAQLKSVPSAGIGFGLLRDRGLLDPIPGADAAKPDVCFNFLGRIDTARWCPMLLSFDDESLNRAPQQVLGYPLEVTAGVLDGQLVVDFDYGRPLEREVALRVADGVVETLLQLAAEATSAAASTPAEASSVSVSGVQSAAGPSDADPQVVESYPATSLQQALIFQVAANPNVGMYVAQSRLELTGALDVDVLRRAIELVVGRHPILRTTFDWESGTKALQVVTPDVRAPFVYEDWSELAPEAIDAKCVDRLRQDRLVDDDLATGPLLRFACLRTDADVHALLATVHHVLVDGWSFSLLLAEVVSAYRSLAEGRRPLLPQPSPFRDYVEWLGSLDYERAEGVWRNELRGTTPRRLSATWTSYSDKQAADVGERHDFLGEASTSELRDLGARNGLTQSAVLQSAWALALSQVYGASDLVVGVVASMRSPELRNAEEMLGLLVETMPVRVRIDPRHQVVHWLRLEQERHVELREYGYASLQRIYSWLGISPDNELFDTLFTYRNFPMEVFPDIDVPSSVGVRVVEPPFTRRTGYAVVAAPKPGRELDLAIFYEREHVSETQADEIIGLYTRTVRTIVADPYQVIGSLLG